MFTMTNWWLIVIHIYNLLVIVHVRSTVGMDHINCHVVMGVQCHTLDRVALDSYYYFPIAGNCQTLWPTINNMTKSAIVRPFELVMHTTWHMGFQFVNCLHLLRYGTLILRVLNYSIWNNLLESFSYKNFKTTLTSLREKVWGYEWGHTYLGQ